MVTVSKQSAGIVLEAIDFELKDKLSDLLKDWYEADSRKEEKKASGKGRKYVYLDSGTSGAFLLDKEDMTIWCIKAYGVKHPDKLVGRLGEVTGKDLVEKRFWNLK